MDTDTLKEYSRAHQMDTGETKRKKKRDTQRDIRRDTETNKLRETCTATSTVFLQTHPPGPSALLGK